MNQAISISSLFSVSIHSAEFVVSKLKLPRKDRKMERIEIYIGGFPEVYFVNQPLNSDKNPFSSIYTYIQIIFSLRT